MVLLQKEIKRITIRPNGTEKQIRPVWTPWANTILYIPMDTDFLDHSGNNYQWDGWHWTYSIQTVNGVNAWYWSWWYIRFTWLTDLKANSWTCCVWLKNLLTSNRRETYSYLSASNSNNAHSSTLITNWWKYWAATNLYGSYDVISQTSWMNTNWHLVTTTCNGTNLSIYVDNWQPYQASVTNNNNNFVLCDVWSRNDVYTTQYRYWYLSKFIVENKVRTATEISDYYNFTKWNYWL